MQLSLYQTQLTNSFAAAGIDSAALDANLLIQHALGCDRVALVSNPDRILSADELAAIDALAVRRAAREPMAHILGYKDFWKDRFIVSCDVLSPRPDSETLIEAMCDYKADRAAPYNIADLGTGSGALLLSLLREYPHAQGTGIDRSEAALSIAKSNANNLQLSERANFLISDWMQALQSRYDMIITNPPYIQAAAIATLEPEVKDFEPMMALTGGDEGLDAYRQILSQISPYLEEDGILVMELGIGQADAVSSLAKEEPLELREVRKDLAGIERAIIFKKAS